MRITDLSITVHERKNPYGPGYPPISQIGVLAINTDEGITGYNFVSGPGPNVLEQIVKIVKPMLLNRNPLDIGALWNEMWNRSRMLHITAIGFVDVALWDIIGKAAGLPIHRLLGTCREKVPAYASSWRHPEVIEYAEEAVAYKEMGISAYKLHPPGTLQTVASARVPLEIDIESCAAVRKAVGAEMRLMLDSTWSYSYPGALKAGRAIEEMGYYWYEDPLRADDLYGYTRLKQQLSIPILATELSEGGLYTMAPWIVERATDFLRGDVVLKGGITSLVKIAHLAEAFRLNCEVHDGFNALNNVACVHVIMAIANCEYFEILTINPPNTYGFSHLNYGLERPIEIDSEGFVHAPTKPGLGYEIDWDLIKSAEVGVLR